MTKKITSLGSTIVTQIEVKLLDKMGDCISVVNAARVSFDKVSHWKWPGPTLSEKDAKLLNYLAKHQHWSPFAHCFATFRIKAPIFVARQLQKHTVGLAWNEVSRRYVDSEPSFYEPTEWRKKADNVKQGSSDEVIDDIEHDFYGFTSISKAYPFHIRECKALYDSMIKAGVCPEQARMVLPQSMMTEWIWSGSLMAFARVCKLRLDGHTQRETQEVARLIADYLEFNFPFSWKALIEH